MLGKGRAEAIGDRDIALLADEIGCHPADLEAIAEVESRGFGWFKDGRMKILFEKHWFYKLLDGQDRRKAVQQELARRSWISPSKGGYKDQSNADARYRLLSKAMKIDKEAALRSISMGKFQIMGFNYATCGFTSAEHMWERFLDSEVWQLKAFAKFLKNNGLYGALRSRDFAAIEQGYNGGGLNGKYARRMAEESETLRAGKWKGYEPGQFAPKPTPRPERPQKPTSKREPSPSVPLPGKAESQHTGKSGRNAGIVAAIIVAAGAAWGWLAGVFCSVPIIQHICGA